MLIEFDPAKNERNIKQRGLDFSRVVDFDFATAEIRFNIRNGETRRVATGFLADRLCVLVYLRKPTGLRIISLRKANPREVRKYEAGRRNLEPRS